MSAYRDTDAIPGIALLLFAAALALCPFACVAGYLWGSM